MLSKRAMSTPSLLGVALFVIFLLPVTPDVTSENAKRDNLALSVEHTASLSDKTHASTSLPVRLAIPSIHVDAPMAYVGLTSDGAMDVPSGPAEVGWFNLGPRPGENGSAVIAGHYGWKNNTPAVFDNVHKLRAGDEILVTDESGAITTFVVRKTRVYDSDDIAPEVFGSSDGKAHLNLITCTGTWNMAEKNFSERLVVFTDKK